MKMLRATIAVMIARAFGVPVKIKDIWGAEMGERS
jgi:hypothetical protein